VRGLNGRFGKAALQHDFNAERRLRAESSLTTVQQRKCSIPTKRSLNPRAASSPPDRHQRRRAEDRCNRELSFQRIYKPAFRMCPN